MKKIQISVKNSRIIYAIIMVIGLAYLVFLIYCDREIKYVIQLIFYIFLFALMIVRDRYCEIKEDKNRIQIKKKIYYSILLIIFIILVAISIFAISSSHENKQLIGSISIALLFVFIYFFGIFFMAKK